MGLDIGRALQIAGQGLGDYAQFMFRKQAYDADRKDQQEQRDWERTFRLAEAAADRESERQGRIDRDRQFYGTQADRERDRLARMGVLPGADFGRDYKASMLPDVTPGISDTGGMVLQGLKQQGQQGVGDLYTALPDAMNRLVAGRGVSEPLPSGGMVTMEPSVRASLINAELDHEAAMARLKAARAGTANQTQEAEDEEAQGLALLNSRGTTEMEQAFGRAYQGARAQNPTMTPGRLAMQVWRGLTAARPDLAPPRQSAGGESAGDRLLGLLGGEELSGAALAPSGAPRPTVAAPAAPEMPQNEAMAQRWDELVAAGVEPDAATKRVLEESRNQFAGVNESVEEMRAPASRQIGEVLKIAGQSVVDSLVRPTVRAAMTPLPRGWDPPGEILPTVYGPLLEGAGRALYSLRPPPEERSGDRPPGDRSLSGGAAGEYQYPSEVAFRLYEAGTPAGAWGLRPPRRPEGALSAQSQEILSGYAPPPPDTLAQQRTAWDRLAELYGAAHTTGEVGPRP